MVLYGDAAGALLTGATASDAAMVIGANGSAVAAPTFANTNYGPTGLAATGGWSEAIADLLLVFGKGSTQFEFRVPNANTICGTGACTSNASFTATLTSASVGVTNRYLPGEVLFRAYVYAAGGLTDTTPSATAQATVDRILY
jgi:hypothetical protein